MLASRRCPTVVDVECLSNEIDLDEKIDLVASEPQKIHKRPNVVIVPVDLTAEHSQRTFQDGSTKHTGKSRKRDRLSLPQSELGMTSPARPSKLPRTNEVSHSSQITGVNESKPSISHDLLIRIANRPRFSYNQFMKVQDCDLAIREELRALFFKKGWSAPEDAACRESIEYYLGLDNKAKKKPPSTIHVNWAVRAGTSGPKVAAALLSLYLYRGARDRRCCGCLEYIVSSSRGAGTRLIQNAKDFLRSKGVRYLFSAADLSRTGGPRSISALQAHARWGFKDIDEKTWAEAGLAFYMQGDVRYMRADLDDE
jgi:hypothetical protein